MGWWEKLLLPFTLPFSVCVAAKRKVRCLVSVNWCGQRETKPGSGICSAMWLHGLLRLVFHFCKTPKGVWAPSPLLGTHASLCRTGFGFPAFQNQPADVRLVLLREGEWQGAAGSGPGVARGSPSACWGLGRRHEMSSGKRACRPVPFVLAEWCNAP